MKVLTLKIAEQGYPFGMIMPGRQLNGWHYRFGFNGQERDNEIAGLGNVNTADYWEYDTRLGRRWNLDPKPSPLNSNYSVLLDNPIFNIDMRGDSGEYYGSEKEINQITDALSKQYDAKISYIDIKDNDGNLVGRKFLGASPDKGDKRYDDLRSELDYVLKDKKMLTFEKVDGADHHMDDIERFGGMKTHKDGETGKITIYIASQWFTGKWFGSGGLQPSYDYHGDSYNFFNDLPSSRTIPFEESLGHEIIHAFRLFHGLYKDVYTEENVARYTMNLWLEKMNLPKRGLITETSTLYYIFTNIDVYDKLYEYKEKK